jgi:hypothetical protein
MQARYSGKGRRHRSLRRGERRRDVLTPTSLGIAGVRSFNSARVGDGCVPGPITKRLTDAYIAEVGCDFVKQYLDRLS